MALTISGLHPIFAGEVTGVDLTKPISREEAATIEAGMNRYGVLVFRGRGEVYNLIDDFVASADQRIMQVRADSGRLVYCTLDGKQLLVRSFAGE